MRALRASIRPAIRWVVTVTAAASVFFFRPEFDDFLYAPIGTDGGGMTLSVLSALSRLDLDPWEEAAELSALPTDTATHRLASLIARLPRGRWASADARSIASRLIELLPRRSSSKPPAADKAHGFHAMTGSTFSMILLCVALGITALILAASQEPSSQDDRAAAPAYTTPSSPQGSVPSSR